MDNPKNRGIDTFVRVLEDAPTAHPFGSDRTSERLYQKTERVVAAVLLLTRHLSPEEPLRKQVRDISLALLPLVLNAPHDITFAQSEVRHSFLARLRHLISLLRMMVIDGLISQPNAEAITAALNELTALGLSSRSPLSDGMYFDKADFSDVFDNRHVKDVKDSPPTATRRATTATDSSMSDRQARIITILKEGGEQNIRDIAMRLPEYGEKTIQRELAALIARGIAKRTGLKRWSKYSLSSS